MKYMNDVHGSAKRAPGPMLLQGSNILGGLLVVRQGQGGVQYAYREKAFGDCAESMQVAHQVCVL